MLDSILSASVPSSGISDRKQISKLCEKAISRLERCTSLLRSISRNPTDDAAISQLTQYCRHISYEGDALCISMEEIFTELESL